jgi:hypothetical protein
MMRKGDEGLRPFEKFELRFATRLRAKACLGYASRLKSLTATPV